MAKKNKNLSKKAKRLRIVIACALLACIVLGCIAIANRSSEDVTGTHRETQVLRGNLTVGISESGTVDIGTVEQTFDLDMSALTRVTTSNSSSSSSNSGGFGGMGGMGGNSSGGTDNMFGQMFSMGGSTTTSSSSSESSLVVESVAVSVGQEISAGDVILVLESEGVDELKNELEENTRKASADLEALIADQKLSMITAEYTLSDALEYGEYAAVEKKEKIASLQADVDDAKTALSTAKTTLSKYKEQLATAQAEYEKALVTLSSAEWGRDNTDERSQTFNYAEAYNIVETAQSNVDSLANKIEQLENRIESAQTNVDRCQTNLNKAKRNYDTGVLSAEETYELRMLAYETAQETYDITVSYLEDNLAEQEETYAETLSKWNEFTSYIDGVNILSEYSGVVTDISLSAGDGLNTKATVITLYNADDVTMTVTVSEDDMTDIEVGGAANVKLTAYSELFEATVSEISDATTDSSGNTTRDVTVIIKGDMSKLYQGMTGEVTFITKQITDVLYVSNRAIIRENGISYIKVMDEKGNVEKVKVVTGFSDGTYVEIKEGLSEGQTVIIEKGDTK